MLAYYSLNQIMEAVISNKKNAHLKRVGAGTPGSFYL